jgi:hypothetical protein
LLTTHANTVPQCFRTKTSPGKDVCSTVLYLQKDKIHELEKPYKLQYNTDDELPQQNTVHQSSGPLQIHDLRGQSQTFSFEKNGFTILEMESKLNPDDFANEQKVKDVYYPEIRALLLKYFGAKRVEILEHLVSNLLLAF